MTAPRPKAPAAGPPAGADELSAADRAILTAIQANFPVQDRPFAVLAERLGMSEDAVTHAVRRLCQTGVIRRVGAVFDSRSLGFASTLVAAKVPPERLDQVAALISEHPGVTHNYRREGRYNLWFTLTCPSQDELEQTLADLRHRTGLAEIHSLPALTVYKIGVFFDLGRPVEQEDAAAPAHPAERAPAQVGKPVPPLSPEQKKLVQLLQDTLPLTPRPYEDLARHVGWTAQQALDQVTHWLEQGVIRRVGAVVNHRRLGFEANGMAVFEVAPDRIDDVGRRLAETPEISHCYRRPPLPDWPYNLFAMVHGQGHDQVRRLVADLAGRLSIPNFDVLFSTTEYKKQSMRYF